MSAICDHLDKTESAVAHVFRGIDDLVQPLRAHRIPMLVGWGDPQDRLEQWSRENEAAIAQSLAIQRKFVAELSAIETLCGCVLQMAYHAISFCSANIHVPEELRSLAKAEVWREKLASFAVGRIVCGLPLGLVVYVGRNQYAHHDEPELRATNCNLLQYMLDHRSARASTQLILDAQVLSESAYPRNLAKAIVDELAWRGYADYKNDLLAALENV